MRNGLKSEWFALLSARKLCWNNCLTLLKGIIGPEDKFIKRGI